MIENLSFFDKVKLMLWKNFCIVFNNKVRFALTIFVPLLFCFFIIAFRLVVGVSNPGRQEELVRNTTGIMASFRGFLRSIELEREKVRAHKPDFQHSVFVPQLTLAVSALDDHFLDLMKQSLKKFDVNMQAVFAEDCEQLKYEMKTEHYFAGICLIGDRPDYRYEFVFPSELRKDFLAIGDGWMTGINWDPRVHPQTRLDNQYFGDTPYFFEGILAVHCVMIGMLQPVLDPEEMEYFLRSIEISKIPHIPFTLDTLAFENREDIGHFIILGYFYPTVFIFNMSIQEKNKGVRTYLKLKGIGVFVHHLAWAIILWLLTSFNTIFVIIACKVGWNSGISVFPKTNVLALYFVLITYCFTNACFCVMMSGLTYSLKYGAKLLITTWFFLFIWYISDISKNDLSMNMTNLRFFMYNCLGGKFINMVLALEAYADGLKWSSFSQNFNREEPILTLLAFYVTGIIFFTLGLFFDQITPGLYGNKFQHLKRFFQRSCSPKDPAVQREYFELPISEDRSYWNIRKDKPFTESITGMPPPIPKHDRRDRAPPVIKIEELSKTIQGNVCANNVSLNISQNKVAVMMGSNGCGKTIFTGMLVGLIKPDKGKIEIDGYDVAKHPMLALQSVGIAYGSSLLLDDLTFDQQMVFHARVKGVPDECLYEERYHEYVADLHLEEFKHVVTKNLPDSVKNQLAIICALTGGSELIILDGIDYTLDTTSRCYLSDLLTNLKETRTIFITTTACVFAEHVGDHISMLSNGELICSGSLSFLKKSFGNNFVLIFYKTNKFKDVHMRHIQAIMEKHIPNIRMEESVPLLTYVSYIVNRDLAYLIGSCLAEIEERSEELCIKNIIVRETSLQDIFNKLADRGEQDYTDYTAAEFIRMYIESSKITSPVTRRFHLLKGKRLFCQRLKGFMKRQLAINHGWCFLFWVHVVIPAAFFSLAFYRDYIYMQFLTGTSREFDLLDYSQFTAIIAVPYVDRLYNRHDRAMANTVWYFREKLFNVKGEILDTHGGFLYDYLHNDIGKKGMFNLLVKLVGGIGKNMGANSFPHLVIYFNNLMLHTAFTTLELVFDSLYKALKGVDRGWDVALTTLPFEHDATNFKFSGLRFSAICVGLGIVVAMQFTSFEFITERTSMGRSRHINGSMMGFEFWLSTFLSFVLKVSILMVVYSIIIFWTGFKEYSFTAILYFNLLLFSCCFYVRYLKFLWGFFFGGEIYVNILFGILLVLGIATVEMETFNPYDVSPLKLYLFFIPMYIVSKSILILFFYLEIKHFCSYDHFYEFSVYIGECKLAPNCCNLPLLSEALLPPLLFLLIMNILFLLIIVFFENWDLVYDIFYKFPLDDGRISFRYSEFDDTNQKTIDNPTSDYYKRHPIVLKRVGKIRKKVDYIKRQSFAVRKGESFILLGPRGSGKTTILQLVAKSILPSFGQILIHGRDLNRSIRSERLNFGICTENICLTEEYQLGHYVESHAMIIGMPKNLVADVCFEMAKCMNIAKNYKTPIHYLSFGTKRRLMFMLALLGNPRIVLMDCPLIGVDIVGRGEMGNLVKQYTRNDGTVLMTLGDILSVDDFSDRIGIIVDGRLKGIGITHEFQSIYAYGYILSIKLEPRMFVDTHLRPRIKKIFNKLYLRLTTFIEMNFDGASVKTDFGQHILFYIPQFASNLEDMFDILITKYIDLNIGHLSITTNTIRLIKDHFMLYDYPLPGRRMDAIMR